MTSKSSASVNGYRADPAAWLQGQMSLSQGNGTKSALTMRSSDTLSTNDGALHPAAAMAAFAAAGLRVVSMGVMPLASAVGSELSGLVAPAVNRRQPGWQVVMSQGSTTLMPMPALTTAVAESLRRQEEDLSNLPENWDGYGAKPLDALVVKSLVDELKLAMRGVGATAPDLIPGADGSVQAEWHLRGTQVFYQVDNLKERFLYIMTIPDNEQTLFGVDAERALPSVISAIKKHQDERAVR